MYGSIFVVMNEFNIVLNLLLMSSSESWREVTPALQALDAQVRRRRVVDWQHGLWSLPQELRAATWLLGSLSALRRPPVCFPDIACRDCV